MIRRQAGRKAGRKRQSGLANVETFIRLASAADCCGPRGELERGGAHHEGIGVVSFSLGNFAGSAHNSLHAGNWLPCDVGICIFRDGAEKRFSGCG